MIRTRFQIKLRLFVNLQYRYIEVCGNYSSYNLSLILSSRRFDNGIGFDPKFNETVFEMFRRLGKSKRNRSTGIGLTIARRIAENHNGKILASGELERGASFSVYLPVGQ